MPSMRLELNSSYLCRCPFDQRRHIERHGRGEVEGSRFASEDAISAAKSSSNGRRHSTSRSA